MFETGEEALPTIIRLTNIRSPISAKVGANYPYSPSILAGKVCSVNTFCLFVGKTCFEPAISAFD